MKSSILLALPFCILPSMLPAQDTECETTHECAQQMVDTLAQLETADDELAAAIKTLGDQVTIMVSLLREEIATAKSESVDYTNSRLRRLPGGSRSAPNRLSTNGTRCPSGSYMIGTTYVVAGGNNAGSVYHGVSPVCEAFRIP